jgi:hypothetical protein
MSGSGDGQSEDVEVRRGKGLAQERPTQLAGASSRQVQELESGCLNARYLVVAAAARMFGVSLSYFVGIAEGQDAATQSSGSESIAGR